MKIFAQEVLPDADQRSADVADLHGQSGSGSEEDHLRDVVLFCTCCKEHLVNHWRTEEAELR